ncbi:hypothetical protein [Phytopseudomonas dryadis]|uniref:hypothetical protein n=1 Tax=Phytopseudomonas dryadis TaxID=2487520 RepID=UPI0010382E79|nr:hypothetical protein [Pseudomonas dryadis]
MATVYHRDQPGAPNAFSTAPYAQAQFANLKAVLIGCLVTGYGNFPAAGWELIDEGANYLILRNGSHSGYVGLTWYSGGAIRIWLSETFTGVDASGVLQGLGRKTGTSANNALAHTIGLTYFAYTTGSGAWYCVADEKTFVFGWVSSHANVLFSDAVPTNYPVLLYVGEDSSGNFIAVGGQLSNVVNGSTIGYFGARGSDSVAGFTALRNPSTGLLVDTDAIVPLMLGISTPTTSTNPSDNGTVGFVVRDVQLGKAAWYAGGAYGGELRGIAPVLTLFNIRFNSLASVALGFASPMSIRQANTPIDIGDTYTYFLKSCSIYSSSFMVTDNPGYW